MKHLKNFFLFLENREFFDPELDDPNDPQWSDYRENFTKAREKWEKDPEVVTAIKKLSTKHEEIFDEFFTDQDSEEFQEFLNSYYEGLKELKHDEISPFDLFMWT
jgi:hypothetical protein